MGKITKLALADELLTKLSYEPVLKLVGYTYDDSQYNETDYIKIEYKGQKYKLCLEEIE